VVKAVAALVLLFALSVNAAICSASAEDAGCLYCGMLASRFAHSWVEIHRPDSDPVGFCSLHCAAIHMALHPGETPSRILVGDYPSGMLTDADRAHWVLGGDISGVMTLRAKWAFRDGEEAERFRREHGGKPTSFEDVIRAAFQDMRSDTLMIQQRRRQQTGGVAPSDQ
jgi:copper chaperone NosL